MGDHCTAHLNKPIMRGLRLRNACHGSVGINPSRGDADGNSCSGLHKTLVQMKAIDVRANVPS